MNKLILNFFGEEVTVETPQTLENLRKEISNKFCFSPSDAAEMLVSYFNEFKKTFIKTEEDFVNFIKKKVYKVDLDISPDSQLYKKSVLKIQEQTEKDKKELDEMIKVKEELQKKKKEFMDERAKQINKLEAKIEELNNRRNKLVKETNKKKTEFSSKIRKSNKKITELQKRLGVSITEEQKKPVSAKLKTIPNQKKTKKVFKKVIKKVPKKKVAKKPKVEKDMFSKVNETINKMVEKITKVVSEQLNKKAEEVEVEKKKIEESNIQLKEEEKKRLFDFASVSQNISEELNKWTKYVTQHTNELTNTLSEKYKNCIDVITSIKAEDKKEEKKELKKEEVKNEEVKKEEVKEEEKEKKLRAVAPKTIHKRIECDGCGAFPIVGNRYRCAICPNLDYCEECEERNKDTHLHPFIKIYSPECANFDIKCSFK